MNTHTHTHTHRVLIYLPSLAKIMDLAHLGMVNLGSFA